MKTSEWRNVLIVIISLRFQTAVKKAYAIDTNMTQNGGQQSCTESPEKSEKASMQVSALLCNLLQTSQVPPLGLEEGQQSSGETALSVNHCAPPGA